MSYDIFIAYAGPDVKKAEQLRDELKHKHHVFVASECIVPGDQWPRRIRNAQRNSRMTVILVSSHTDDAYYLQEEIAEAISLSRRGEHLVVPVLLNESIDLPYGLRIVQSISWRKVGGAKGVAEKLIKIPGERPIQGVAPRAEVFRAEPLDGQVFAVELLTQPIGLKRVRKRVKVIINRQNVRDAVYTTEGKSWLCRELLTGKVETWAKEKDREIHRFLLGKSKEKPDCAMPLHNFPLRWGSGGVLSVVEIKGRKGLWTPFFFRDIEPIGWNIALGASEKESELNDPWKFLLREFLEETLVLPAEPEIALPLECKVFVVGIPEHFVVQRNQARKFAQRHIDIRNRFDGLSLRVNPAKAAMWGAQPERTIYCKPDDTRVDLQILDRKGIPQPPWNDVLITINLMELGIEVIKVLKYELKETDYLLDGEILEGKGFDGGPSLVRMPVALISHKYLRRMFGRKDFSPEYECPEVEQFKSGRWKKGRVKQPSIRPKGVPKLDEIKIFHWDAKRKLDLLKKKNRDVGIPSLSDDELRRYKHWKRNFAQYFFEKGKPTSSNPYRLFTPASAKVLNYYFANL